MTRRTVVLLIALVLAALAAFSVWRYLRNVESNVRADVSEVVVYRATAPIEVGTSGSAAAALIAASTDLAANVEFPGSTIICEGPANRDAPDVDFTICQGNPADLDVLLSGAFAAGPISQGQLITTEMFVAPSELDLDRLSAAIPEGKVAIAINPGNIGSVGGFIRPGDRVNLLATFAIDLSSLNAILANPDTRQFILDNADLSGLIGPSDPIVIQNEDGTTEVIEPPADPLSQYAAALPDTVDFTQTILQELEVIGVGKDTVESPSITADEESPLEEVVIVLEVTPEEAEQIEFARQRAQLALTLLPAEGVYTEFAPRGATVDDIFDFIDRIREQLGALSGG